MARVLRMFFNRKGFRKQSAVSVLGRAVQLLFRLFAVAVIVEAASVGLCAALSLTPTQEVLMRLTLRSLAHRLSQFVNQVSKARLTAGFGI
jgi:hypothetical protein